VLQETGWTGSCDQPFRAFSYPLPPDLLTELSTHVVTKEAALLNKPIPHSGPRLTVKNKELTIAYLSTDFGGHAVGGSLITFKPNQKLVTKRMAEAGRELMTGTTVC
jgi:hypothetical protein